MIQMKNKNKKHEEIEGENVGIDLTTRPKGRVGPLEHALIGSVQPILMVGPHRPRYIEWERVGARDTRFTAATTLSHIPTDLGFARGRREALPASSLLHHDDRIRHGLRLLYTSCRRWSAPPHSSLSVSFSLL